MSKRILSFLASVLGIIVFLLCAVAFVMAHAGECTQGSTNFYIAALFYCGILSLITASLFAVSNWLNVSSAKHRLIVPILTLIAVVLVSGRIYSVVIGGHHPCGEEYDDMIIELGDQFIVRWFYPIQAISFLIANASALWPIVTRRKV